MDDTGGENPENIGKIVKLEINKNFEMNIANNNSLPQVVATSHMTMDEKKDMKNESTLSSSSGLMMEASAQQQSSSGPEEKIMPVTTVKTEFKSQRELKRLAEEKFNNEHQEKAYKRLMHLLTQSKFYNKYLMEKLTGKEDKIKKSSVAASKTKTTRKSARLSLKQIEANKENEPASTSKSSNRRRANDNNVDEEYGPSASKQQKKITIKNKPKKFDKIIDRELKSRITKKINNSNNDIETELVNSSASDTEITSPHDDDDDDDDDDDGGTASGGTTEDDEKTLKQKTENTIINNYVKSKYLRGELRDYQKVGLSWLIALYENGLSGILADEMGLGKTIQSIALICHLIEQHIAGPYLIIAPLSTVPNWQIEFSHFAPEIPFVTLHGPKEERIKQLKKINNKHTFNDGFESFPVVLTTYEVAQFEKTFMKRKKWRYIIVDEGQRLKNPNCMLVNILSKCTSINRLILTGTPLQNDLTELWALLNFLMPEVFDDLDVFESWFDAKDLLDTEGTNKFLKQEKDKQIVKHLREILKPFMLRRLKIDVCPDIPLKKEVIIYAPMSDVQRELYTALLDRDIRKLHRAEPEKLIIDDENGKRPIRKCTLNNKFSSYYQDIYKYSTPSSPVPANGEINNTKLNTIPNLAQLEKHWAEHIEITAANAEYLSRVTFGNNQVMYRQIVNHPYLIHCPLNDRRLPLANQELINASGKFLVLDALLKKLYEQGHKVLLFSTWKRILDFIEEYLDMTPIHMRPWKYTRLDGDYSIKQRKVNIDLFNNDPSVFLFLITTRAGGVGLNLMGADTVIIFDSDWNPQVDIQAMARCHRIGQTRPVMIYKLCTKGSYDEFIVDRAAAKRKLEKLVMSDDLNIHIGLNEDTLLMMKKMLEKNEYEIVNSEKGVFTDEELEKLVDRSDLIRQKKENTETE